MLVTSLMVVYFVFACGGVAYLLTCLGVVVVLTTSFRFEIDCCLWL